jgi:hypothetical protein
LPAVEPSAPPAPGGAFATAPNAPLFARAVFALDRRLQKSNGVFCFSSDKSCIFRISFAKLERATVLSNGSVLDAGCPVVELHLWNERLPILTKDASPIAWGLRMSRSLEKSLRLLSAYLEERPEYGCVGAAQADMAFGTRAETAQLLRISGRYGFVPPACAQREAFARRMGRNIFISMMVLARNATALRLSTLRRDRVRVFLARDDLDRRFGNGPRERPRAEDILPS